MTPFKLAIGVTILPPVESILHQLFVWQHHNTWCMESLSKTPMITMANMARSPAAIALDMLLEMFLIQGEPDRTIGDRAFDAGRMPSFLRVFLFLHKGQVFIASGATIV